MSKKFQRIIGVILMVVGFGEIPHLLLFFLANVFTDSDLEIIVIVVFIAVMLAIFSAIGFLGLELFKKGRAPVETAPQPPVRIPAMPASRPSRLPAPVRESPLEVAKARQIYAMKERELQAKFNAWAKEHPKYREDLARWDAEDSECFLPFSGPPHCQEAKELDGTTDETGVGWFTIMPGVELSKAAGVLLEQKQFLNSMPEGTSKYLHEELDLKRFYMASGVIERHRDVVLRVPEWTELPPESKERDELFRDLRENGIDLMMPSGEDTLRSLLDDGLYRIMVKATYPGSADDAATYGVIGMERVSEEEIKLNKE